MKKLFAIISAVIITSGFLYWAFTNAENTPVSYFFAFLSCVLSYCVFIRFVPLWLEFWSKDNKTDIQMCGKQHIDKKTFFAVSGASIAVIFAVMSLTYLMLKCFKLDSSLSFWLCTDSMHYMDIARDWYLSEGTIHRLVQLVFFPGYPVVVRLVNAFINNYLYSGLIVSWISFVASTCVLYKLIRLDFDEKTSFRAIKYLLICPSVFFYVAPMSDSLFLFLCISCLYCIRTKRITTGCIIAGMASFTRSLGITLIVPIFFEIINDIVNSKRIFSKNTFKNLFSLPLVFFGFLIYLYINYEVSGNPFQFMVYQSNHWGQNLGFYFDNAAKFYMFIKKCIVQGYPDALIGKVIPNLLTCFIPLMLMLITVKRLRPSYTAWFIAYYMFAMGTTELLSGPRYMMSYFPLFISLAIISENKKVNTIATLLSIFAFLGYMVAFVQRWSVW